MVNYPAIGGIVVVVVVIIESAIEEIIADEKPVFDLFDTTTI